MRKIVYAKFYADASTEDEAIDIVAEQCDKMQHCDYDEAIAVDNFNSIEEPNDKWQEYIHYLMEWSFMHADSQYTGNSPLSYERYCKNNFEDWL